MLQNSDETDLVYDGKPEFNLFRRDLHYFWFLVGRGKFIKNYHKITKGKFIDYDTCFLIKLKRPKFISDFNIDMIDCELFKYYEKTIYENLYIRKD